MKLICVLAALVLTTGCVTIKDSGGGSRFVASIGPNATGKAIFTKVIGLQDTAVTFEVVDSKIGVKPINIGFVGDANWKGTMPHAAVWSKDGSVIAVQGADFKGWSHVYDFRKHDLSLTDTYPPETRATKIEKLLRSRGGTGPKVLGDWANFDKIAQPVKENLR